MTQTKKSTKPFEVYKNDTWVKPFLRQYRPSLILALFLGILTFFCASALMFTSGYLISRAAEMPGNIMLIYVPIVLTRAFGIGRPVFRYAERLTSHNWVLKITSNLRLKLYNALEGKAIFLSSLYKTGDILGLLAEDIGHIQNLYLRTIFPTLVAWAVYALAVIVLGFFSWWFALVMLLLLAVVVVLVPLVAVLHNGALQARQSALKAELYSELTDNILGVSDWIIAQRSNDYLKLHQSTQRKLRSVEDALESSSQKRTLLLQGVCGLIIVALLLWSGMYFGGEGKTVANWIAAFVLCFFPLIDAFMPLSAAALEANKYRGSIKRLNELSETALPFQGGGYSQGDNSSRIIASSQSGKLSQNTASLQKADSCEHTLHSQEGKKPHLGKGQTVCTGEEKIVLSAPYSLCVENLSFGYSPQQPLLDKVTLTLEPGQKVALLGRSGAGKTTLALLLRGDLHPTDGRVTLNGLDTFDLGDSISRYIGVIQQKTYLFNTSLRNNLKLGKQDATDDELWAVLDKVGMRRRAEKLPQKLDTLIDEAGLCFSGGERHRVTLARVLLQDVPLVILDEPTIGLDLLTEKALLKTFFETMQDKTVIMITHHLLGASYMDRVLFLENGRIVLDDSPKELAATNAYYQKLLAFDQGGF